MEVLKKETVNMTVCQRDLKVGVEGCASSLKFTQQTTQSIGR